jgi:hypothetical protein
MKKVFYLLLTLSLSLGFVGCSNDDDIVKNSVPLFKEGRAFATLKSSGVYVTGYHNNTFHHAGHLYSWGNRETELLYRGNRNKKPAFSIALRVRGQEPNSSYLTIFLNDIEENITIERIEEVKNSFLIPYHIVLGDNAYDRNVTSSNFTNKNLIAFRSGNIVTYQFNNFRTVYDDTWSYVLDGEIVFEIIELN